MARLVIQRRTEWQGNGFGSYTVWLALLDGALVGEWSSRHLWAWAGARRLPVAAYSFAEWRRDVKGLA